MAAPSYVAASAGTDTSTATATWTVTGPSGLAAGDIIVLAAIEGSLRGVTTNPSGFKYLGFADESADGRLHVWFKVAGVSEAGPYSIVFDNTTTGMSVYSAYTSTDPTRPLNNVMWINSPAAGTAITLGPVTPKDQTVMAVGIVACDPTAAGNTFTWDSPATERIDSGTSTTDWITLADQTTSTSAAFSMTGTLSASETVISAVLLLSPTVSSTPSAPPIGNAPARSYGNNTRQFIKRLPDDAGPVVWTDWFFEAASSGITFNAPVSTMTLSQATPTKGEIFTASVNSVTLSQAAATLAQAFAATPAGLMTLSQATPTKAQSISAGTASLMTLSQGTPTIASFILTSSSLLTLSQAVTSLTNLSTFQAPNNTMTLSQATAAVVESVSAGTASLMTLSQATPAEVAAVTFQSPNNTVTLGAAPATFSESVQAAASSVTLSQGTPSLSATITSTPAALLTLGAAGVTLDFGSLTVNADSNTMTLGMGSGISLDLGGGAGGDHGNIAWYILDRRRRENQ